jgi:hypothetical protein
MNFFDEVINTFVESLKSTFDLVFDKVIFDEVIFDEVIFDEVINSHSSNKRKPKLTFRFVFFFCFFLFSTFLYLLIIKISFRNCNLHIILLTKKCKYCILFNNFYLPYKTIMIFISEKNYF